jgi:predicted metal-binding membrane protein
MPAETTTDSSRRSPGEVRSLSPAIFVGRDRLIVSICIVLTVGLAWVYLVRLAHQMAPAMAYGTAMAAMGMTMDAPWTSVDILLTFVMWVVMMVGMMAGAAAPVLLLFAGARATHGDRGVPLSVLMFGLGYLTVWVGFSACAALVQWALHETAMLSSAMAASSPWLAGTILVAAGAYQLTPLKRACLVHCRSPLGFLMTTWRDGKLGAMQMGVRHGAYCLGCCWALMCVLFVVGVMNLGWVIALTGFVLLEKVGPAGIVVSRVAGAAMIGAGILTVI